jgi:hypothetical protein
MLSPFTLVRRVEIAGSLREVAPVPGNVRPVEILTNRDATGSADTTAATVS